MQMHATALQGLRALHLCPCSSAATLLQGARCQSGAETELIHFNGWYTAAAKHAELMHEHKCCASRNPCKSCGMHLHNINLVRGFPALLPCYMWLAAAPRPRRLPPSLSRLTLVHT